MVIDFLLYFLVRSNRVGFIKLVVRPHKHISDNSRLIAQELILNYYIFATSL